MLALVALGLLVPASAGATVVTIGSPLTAPFVVTACEPDPCTVGVVALPEPGAVVTSPVDGVIVRWRMLAGSPSFQYKLRVLTPAGGTNYTRAATSSAQTPSSAALQTFPANLPIHAGQTIGMDLQGAAPIGANSSAGNFSFFQPPLADGPTASTGPNTGEFAYNADVATIPSNSDTLGGVKRNKKKGTATLAVSVPGPGTLSLTGNNVKPQRPAREASASSAVSAAGTVKLLVKARGKAKKKLNKTGKAKVKVTVTYTPTGDLPGVPNTETKHLKLVKKLG